MGAAKRCSSSIRNHPLLLKRCIASVLLLCLGLFSLEVVIADVHDGDAQGERAAVAFNEQSVTSKLVDQGDSGVAMALVFLDDQTGAHDDAGAPTAPSRHAAHVCHCMHAHGVSVPVVVSLPARPEVSRAAVQLVMRTPDQVDVDVHQRPPIA